MDNNARGDMTKGVGGMSAKSTAGKSNDMSTYKGMKSVLGKSSKSSKKSY